MKQPRFEGGLESVDEVDDEHDRERGIDEPMSHHDCDRVVNANADTRLKIDRTAIASMKNS